MRNFNIFKKIDWIFVALYLALVVIGLSTVYAAVYDATDTSFFNFSSVFGKQFLWALIALVVGLMILIFDARIFSSTSLFVYIFALLLLCATLVIGTTIAGSKSWIRIGSLSFQTCEFAKLATALFLSHYLSSLDIDFSQKKYLLRAYLIILIPAGLVLLQGDAGSTLVFASFLIVLFREGMSGLIFIIGLTAIILFVFTLLFSKIVVFAIIIGIVGVALFFIERKSTNIWKLVCIVVVAVMFVFSVDFVFHNILKPHQQTRINIVLGLEDDPQGASYNINQSMIAIGSGGFAGKGYLQGTMTKYNFVPEHHTDFIFCTIGEEGGFWRVFLFFGFYLLFLIKIIKMAERQKLIFSRVYGYSIASILFFHFFFNIGMTIGILPVIGIPLPFISYGGSSFFVFSLMIWIFIKLDSCRNDFL